MYTPLLYDLSAAKFLYCAIFHLIYSLSGYSLLFGNLCNT